MFWHSWIIAQSLGESSSPEARVLEHLILKTRHCGQTINGKMIGMGQYGKAYPFAKWAFPLSSAKMPCTGIGQEYREINAGELRRCNSRCPAAPCLESRSTVVHITSYGLKLFISVDYWNRCQSVSITQRVLKPFKTGLHMERDSPFNLAGGTYPKALHWLTAPINNNRRHRHEHL